MKKIVFIKLGGSLITDKTQPYVAKMEVIQTIAYSLKKIIAENPEIQFIIGNGAGSFGHFPAVKHNIKNGITNNDQLFGFCEVQDGVARLNRIVVAELLNHNISVCSVHPSSIFTAKNGKINSVFLNSLEGLMSLGIIPTVYGDIVYDEEKGCKIFSTEDVFEILIQEFIKKNYHVAKVIHLTTVAGVLDGKGNVISRISKENFEEVKQHLYKTEGYDVTGGMLHKIQTALSYAEKNIQTQIIHGDNLSKILLAEDIIDVGTSIF
jgi:isopentenyl phosphate kinase